MLEGVGVNVMLASDGAKAIELLRECRFDCVLMDMRMPVMDGLQATRTIRSDVDLSKIPVVGLTANANSEDHAQCLQAGMNAVVTKPINPQHLFATLLQCTTHHAETSVASLKPEWVVSPSQLDTQALPVWDAQALQLSVGNFPKIHSRLIAHFLSNAQAQLERVVESVDQMHYLDAAEEAHKLKSAAKTIGALRFGDLCDQLERAGRMGDALECQSIRASLPEELDAVTRQIHALST
jgi:CheY-like chemotaxis protein/HPt (histidine-containing phosphotransfer) domain-containing protein